MAGYSLNTFPLVLSVKEDGSISATVRNVEQFMIGSAGRTAAAFERAGQSSDKAFKFDGARREVERLAQSLKDLQARSALRTSDPLGIRGSLASVNTSAIQKVLSAQAQAETQLDQQRARSQAERINGISREFDAAMGAIRARQEAQTQAFKQAESEGQRLIGLDRQRAAQFAKLIAAPQRNSSFGLDTAGADVAASAARQQAARLEAIARAANTSMLAMKKATATDIAYAEGAREAAAAAKQEADRLTALAATQARVAAGYSAARGRFAPTTGDDRSGLQRLQAGEASLDRAVVAGVTLEQVMGRVADRSAGVAANAERTRVAMAQQVIEASRLVAAPVQIQSPVFNPQGLALAAAAAEKAAIEQRQLATATQLAADTAQNATPAQRALALAMDAAATEAEQEAIRLRALALAQGLVAEAAQTAGIKIASANDQVTGGVRSQRFATLQASQQFQDFFIQIQGGQSVLVAASQQLSQLAFVMAGSGGEAGKLARFIAGPAGSIGFAALALIPIIGLLIPKMFGAGEATAKMGNEQETLAKFLDRTTGEIYKQITATQLLAAAQAQGRGVKEEAKARDATLNQIRLQTFNTLKQSELSSPDMPQLVSSILESEKRSLQAAFDAFNKNNSATGLATAINKLAAQKGASKGIKDLAEDITGLASSVDDSNQAIEKAQALKAFLSGTATQRQKGLLGVNDPNALRGLVEIAAATDKYALSIAKLKKQREDLETAFKKGGLAGGNDEFVNRAAAIDKQIEALRKLQAEEKKTANARGELAKFASPVDGPITSGFGARVAPKKGASTFHPAIDFGVPVGTAIRAPQVGTVEAIGYDKGLGKYVIVDHGAGTKSRFNHLSDNSVVSVGQRVEQGDTIGRSGNTGLSTGPHLDYRVYRNGKPVDPRKGPFPIDAAQSNETAERAAEKSLRIQQQLADFGERAAERVQRINEQFNEQPRLIDQAAAATRELDAIMADLIAKKPPGWQETIAQIQATGAVIQDGVQRPLRQLLDQQQDQLAVQKLITAGREDEADALEIIQRLEEQMGPLSTQRKEEILASVQALKDQSRELADQQRLWDVQIRAAQSLQNAFTSLLSGDTGIKGFADQLTKIRRQAIGEKLSIELLGDLGADTRDALTRGATKVEDAAKKFAEVNTTFTSSNKTFADAVSRFAGAVDRRGSGEPSVAQIATTPSAYGPLANAASIAAAKAVKGSIGSNDNEDIVVTGQRLVKTIVDAKIAGKNGNVETNPNPLQGRLNTILDGLRTPLSLLAQTIGGKGGAVIDSFLNIKSFSNVGSKIAESIGGSLGKTAGNAFAGIGQGLFADSIVKAIGLKGSKLGASIGGAIGNAILPGIGGFIGGTIGSIVGGLFKKTPRASIQLSTDANGNLDTGAEKAKGKGKAERLEAARESANAVFDALQRLGDSFGTGLKGGFNIGSIGSRNGSYVFDPTGQNRTKGAGVETFKNKANPELAAAQAVQAAIRNAIEKGIITGLRESTKRLLTAGKDFNKALEKAIAFEDVFTRLKRHLDPVGAAIDALDKEFNQLRRIFAEAGASTAEYSQLEQLYALERAEAVKSAAKDVTSTLQSLLDDLRFKGDTGLSLRTREAAAREAYNPFKADILAGRAIDQDKFADYARAYLDLSRQIFGSSSKYFERLQEVTDLTVKAIQNAGGTVTAISTSVQQAAASATGLGGAASSTTPTATGTAVNDNGASAGAVAGSIVQAIALQTQALQIPTDRAAWFTKDVMSEAVSNALASGTFRTDASGITTFSVTPVVDSLSELKDAIIGRFDDLIEVSANMGSIVKAGPASTETKNLGGLQLGSMRNG
jgi:murein DD-endopeptidase MepM/ murein hydrolase activator NlpD